MNSAEPKELCWRKKDKKLTLEGKVVDAMPVERPVPVIVWDSDKNLLRRGQV